jgi:vacuolar protein sorting-associated protein 45
MPTPFFYLPDFTNRIEDMRLQDLAEGDTKELVACVHEIFGDFIVLEHHHALIPLHGKPHMALAPMSWDFGESAAMLNRLTEGLASLMLSLRRRFQVRYQRDSEVSQRLAQTLHHLSAREQRELFDFGNRSHRSQESPPLLLIIDRKDDPVTPLLSQWTYQAMLHEILGLFDNRVSLRHVPGIRSELEEAVLDPTSDSFYASTMYSNFGDVGMAVKSLVDGSSWKKENGRKNFDSLDEMAEFVEGLPELSQQQSMTAKHVTLMTELSHAVEKRALMQISSLEQDIVCGGSQLSSHFEAISQFVRDPNISGKDKLRLVALFALRYERDGKTQIGSLMDAVSQSGVDVTPVKTLIKWCSADGRVMDIFADRSLTSRIATLAKQHLKGVENVYTQHTPPIVTVLERAARGKLSDTDYINVSSADEMSQTKVGGRTNAQQPPRLVVCCIVGGTTYEEVKAVAELNAAAESAVAGVRFILVGTGNVQNSGTFMADWDEVALMERYHARSGYR